MGAEPEEPDTGEDAGAGMVGGRNLPMAIAVGLGLAALFLGSLFWHPAAFSAVVAGLTLVAYVESDQVLRDVDLRLDTPVLIVATLVMLFGAYEVGHAGQAVGVGVLVLGSVLWQLSDAKRTDVARRLSMTLLFGLWVGFLASFAVLLVNRPDGAVAVLAVIGAVVLTDIGGFAFGVWLGRHKIAPSVSPNKTWEGLFGGVLVALLGAVLVLPRIGDTFDVTTAAVLAVTCGLAGFLGDLTESMIKRDLGVKDLGRVLPGHGGILDRVDGIIFALPVGYYAVTLLA
jgi:phosphatidate cytidylyltransferase